MQRLSPLRRLWRTQASPAHAYRSVAAQSGLIAVGMLFQLGIGSGIPGMPLWPPLAASLLACILFAMNYRWRHELTLLRTSTIYLLNTFSVVAVFAITNSSFVANPAHWVPFQGDKLGCLVSAMLAPSFAVGLIGISVHVVAALVQWFVYTDMLHTHFEVGEPWISLVFALAGYLTLCYRFAGVARDRELQRVRAETEAMKKVAMSLFALRDLMNTPLQTIEIAQSLIRIKGCDSLCADALARAVDRMRSINALLSRHIPATVLYDQSLGFDAERVLGDIAGTQMPSPPSDGARRT